MQTTTLNQISPTQSCAIIWKLAQIECDLRNYRWQFINPDFAYSIDRESIKAKLEDIITQAQIAFDNLS